jgi:ribosomal-protein-alanine N-acetyltransferase
MEQMPYRDSAVTAVDVAVTVIAPTTVSSNWKHALPTLTSPHVTLRDLEPADAPALFAMLASSEVARFISPPPSTLDGFAGFIAFARAEREAGRHACFAVVPRGMDTAVGIFQVRQLDSTFTTAEWGFALGSGFWGTGVFTEASSLVLDFAFGALGVRRLEARAAVRNGRGNAALQKIGATCEGVLRQSFLRNGEYLDQHLWSLLAKDWPRMKHNTVN